MTTPPLHSTTAPVDPGSFKGDKNLKYDGNVVEYFGKRYYVNITDENGKTTRLSDPDKVKRIVRMLAQANFHISKQDLLQTTISESKINVSGKPVNVFNAEKVNRLFLKVFDQVKNRQAKEDFTIEFLEEAAAPKETAIKIPPPPDHAPPPPPLQTEAQKKAFYEKRIASFQSAILELNDPVFDRLKKGQLKEDERQRLEEAIKKKRDDVEDYKKFLPNPPDDTQESTRLRTLITEASAQLDNLYSLVKAKGSP